MGGGLNYDRTNETSIGGGTTMEEIKLGNYIPVDSRNK